MAESTGAIKRIFTCLGRDVSAFEWEIEQTSNRGFIIERAGARVHIQYCALADLTMSVGYLLSNEDRENFRYEQALTVDRLGVFLDCARNNVAKISTLKRFALNAAFMGYNHLQLYLEDCFELDGEGYFGYMRGRYTAAELKELNAFCDGIGVELTPCIQTLAHLSNIFRHNVYQPINDCADILLVEDERTYALIGKMFAKIKECFTSKQVNVGMDEAHLLGAGKYLDKHGYQHRNLIIRKHLKKVLAIAEEYGLEVSLFNDMFFRVLLDGDYYDDNDAIGEMPDHIKDSVPKNATLVYWDYYHLTQKPYERMLKLHKDLTDKITFAGGAWKWQGFAPFNRYTCETVFPALEACRTYDVRDIILTSWGDDGGECSFNALLGAFAVCAEKLYQNPAEDGQTDRLCKWLTGYTAKELFALDLPNIIVDREFNRSNPCKYLLFDDLLIGAYSDKSDGETDGAYRKNAEILKTLAQRGGEYAYLFDTMYKLCAALELKGDLARKIRLAYKQGDKAFLEKAVNDTIPQVKIRLQAFYEAFRFQWEKESKPFGFEVQDARLGGLLLRLEHVRKRLENYLVNGGTVDELEAEFLPTDDNFIPSIIEAKKAITLSQVF